MLVQPLHDSGLVSFRRDFTQRLKSILDMAREDPNLPDSDYRSASIKNKVEELIFSIMKNYSAHDPLALRIYIDKANNLINDFEKRDADINAIIDISYKVDNVKAFVSSIGHLRESGSVLIGLERLYSICRSLYDGSYDYSDLRETSADDNMNNILKKKSKEAMVAIADLVSKINK